MPCVTHPYPVFIHDSSYCPQPYLVFLDYFGLFFYFFLLLIGQRVPPFLGFFNIFHFSSLSYYPLSAISYSLKFLTIFFAIHPSIFCMAKYNGFLSISPSVHWYSQQDKFFRAVIGLTFISTRYLKSSFLNSSAAPSL